MLDELDKYKEKDHFQVMQNSDLEEECNAPDDKSGVFLVYILKDGRVQLGYIGRSGELTEGGSMVVNQNGLGGIKEEIVNGHQFGDVPRKISWPAKIMEDNIDGLDIYWFVTHNDKKPYKDCPKVLQKELLRLHYSMYGFLPEWNKG